MGLEKGSNAVYAGGEDFLGGRTRCGRIEVAGAPAASREARAHVGYIGHDTLLYPALTARENLLFITRDQADTERCDPAHPRTRSTETTPLIRSISFMRRFRIETSVTQSSKLWTERCPCCVVLTSS